MKRILSLLFAVYLFSAQVHAQTQLTNNQESAAEFSASPAEFCEYNGKLYFAAASDYYGNELWVSEGTETSTQLFKDLIPGPASSWPTNLLTLRNDLYFIANDENGGQQLFKTNGSSEGTHQLTDFNNKRIARLTKVNNYIFFIIKDNSGLQVWRSTGTKAGTRLVKDRIGTSGNVASYEGSFNGLFMFECRVPGSNSTKIWRSDGSAEGTYSVTPEVDGNGAGDNGFGGGGTAYLTQHIVFNNKLYFVARSSSIFGISNSVGIMRTDGTYFNTEAVKGVHDGNRDLINFADVAQANGKLYFSFFELDKNRLFIWESDGTEAGTQKVYDKSSAQYFSPSNLVVHEGKILFTSAGDTDGGTSLISFDPQTRTATVIVELEATTGKPAFMSFSRFVNKLHITSPGLIMAGMAKPTNPLARDFYFADIQEKNSDSAPALTYAEYFYPYNGFYYFTGYTSDTGRELWSTSGTLESTGMLKNINRGKAGFPFRNMMPLNDKIIFNAIDRETSVGRELWQYNTNTKEASVLADINTGISSSDPDKFVRFKGKLYFAATHTETGRELWSTDGTSAGTLIVSDIFEGSGSSSPTLLTNIKDQNLFFSGKINQNHFLLKTDGTTITTLKDMGVNEYNVPFTITSIVTAGERIFFITEGAGSDLWVSDGTAAGTVKVLDLCNIKSMCFKNGSIYFTANEANNCTGETKLWKSDGTTSGTTTVYDTGQTSLTNIRDLVNYNGDLYFVAFTEESGNEIWKTDGTAASTTLLKEIALGTSSAISSPHFTVFDDKLYFAANDGVHGSELWRTDGTRENTLMVDDLAEGRFGSIPYNLTPVEDRLYFNAITPEHGAELWVTNGTDVTMVADILSGANHGDPANIMSVNNSIYFTANTLNAGRQLWTVSEGELTGIEGVVIDNNLTIFPNPASDYVAYKYEKGNNQRVEDIFIIDMLGKKHVAKINFEEERIHLDNLAPGIYLMVFQIGNERLIKKFIKQSF